MGKTPARLKRTNWHACAVNILALFFNVIIYSVIWTRQAMSKCPQYMQDTHPMYAVRTVNNYWRDWVWANENTTARINFQADNNSA